MSDRPLIDIGFRCYFHHMIRKRSKCYYLSIGITALLTKLSPGFSNSPMLRSPEPKGSVAVDSVQFCMVIRSARQLVSFSPDSALALLEEAWAGSSVELRDRVGLDYFLARADVRLSAANVAACMRECDAAMRYRREGRPDDEASIDIRKGRAFGLIGEYARAARFIEHSLLVYSSKNDLRNAAECQNELGWYHYVQGQYALAERQWRSMLVASRSIGDLRLEAIALRRIGVACLYLYDPDDLGHAYYDSALAVSRLYGDPHELASIYSNIGFHMDSALVYARLSGDSILMYKIMHTTGVVEMNRSGKSELGLRHCKPAYDFAKRVGNRMLYRDASQCLCEAYRIAGRWKEAFQASEEWRSINVALVSDRARDEMVMSAFSREFESKTREDSIAHAAEVVMLESARTVEQLRADRNHNAALTLGFGGFLLLAGGGFVYRIDRKRRRERFERDTARMQTQVLRTQMNPHFIFNALNSINNYVQENERDLASGFLTKFARLMRLVLENSRHEEVPLTQDLEALRLYMDLEQARMNNRFRYEVDIDPAIDEEATLVPPLVLQPFVENAIWHGLSRKEGAGLLRLSVKQRDGALTMIVEDDGAGRDTGAGPTDLTAPSKTSMGTGITQARLEMLGKQRGGEAGFHYVEVSQGTCVEVRLPLAQQPFG